MEFWKNVALNLSLELYNIPMLMTIPVFLHCFYDANFQWPRKKMLLALAYMVVDVIIVLCGGSGFRGISDIVFLVLALYDYKGKKWKGFLRWVLLYFIFELCFGILGYNSISLLFPEDTERMIQTILEKGLMAYALQDRIPDTIYFTGNMIGVVFFGIVFCYLYFALYKRDVVMQCGKPEKALAVGYPVLCLVVSFVIAISGVQGQVTWYMVCILSILMALTFPIFAFYIRINNYYQKQTEAQEQYMQAELEHFMQYKQAQEETVRFRHDIRNNLLCVNELLQSGKTEDAREYLNDLLSTTEALRKKYISGDEMLDCVIGMKSEFMSQKGIRFNLDGVVAGGLQWKVMDVCAVFANAFDNAIEACEKLPLEERYIHLTIKATEQFWFLTLENPVHEMINTKRLFQKNGGYTSKKDAKQHGIGTYNMKRVVESHGGIVKANCRDDVFALEIMIDKAQTQKIA